MTCLVCLVKLVVTWDAKSSRLDLLLAVGSPHCRGPVGRLARHDTRRCRLCHFSIEDAIDPALSAIWFDRAPI